MTITTTHHHHIIITIIIIIMWVKADGVSFLSSYLLHGAGSFLSS